MGAICSKTKSSSEVPVGTDFNLEKHYKLETTLKLGVLGPIVKAKPKASHKKVVVKTIKKSELTYKLKKQIYLTMSLSHPNLVSLYSVHEDNSNFYLVTKYCPGGSISNKLLCTGKIKELDACRIMKQVLGVVFYLHAKGIRHGNLNLESFVFETEKDLKLVDLGLTEKLTAKTENHPYFKAPELILGNSLLKNDLWSCGVILYTLLSGKKPFFEKSCRMTFNKILTSSVDFSVLRNHRVSELGVGFIQKLLSKDPNSRISAEEALKHPWILQCELYPYFNILETVNNDGKDVQTLIIDMINSQLSFESINELKKILFRLDFSKSGILKYKDIQKAFIMLWSFEANYKLARILKSSQVSCSTHFNYVELFNKLLGHPKVSKKKSFKCHLSSRQSKSFLVNANQTQINVNIH